MSNLPPEFEWLANLTGPLMVVEAVKEYGTLEWYGPESNPKIMGWAKEAGITSPYAGDHVPWCGVFLCVIAKRAGKLPPPIPERARSWIDFGVPSLEPSLGDVLVVHREDGGFHVTIYVGENDTNYYGLGGNQKNAVTIAKFSKSQLHACRRPVYRQQPDNVRPVQIITGPLVSSGTETHEA